MSVIGFDIGNESCVIAVAKRGGVDVLLNNESKRETPAVVSFGGKQRFLGSAGAAYATANPKSTVSQIKRLIGKLYKEVEEDLKQLPFTTREGPRGGILIELDYMETKWIFTPVEILAMLLKHLKQLTEKNLETSVVDCVIGIPSYFSDLQRRLYLDAALLAGLKPLRLMHDGTAIALGYGMYKTDFSDSGPTIVMFVDIGHCDTQVTLAAFEQGRMKILSHTFDQNLGGRDFDEVLFNHFAAQFNEEYKLNVYSNVRASVRLRASCEKVKKVLSANAEAPLSIECLIGDIDVRGFITREEFENLSCKLLERVTVPCDIALKNSSLSVDKMHIIELVGSGSRIPAITKKITSFFKKEPTRTLNASECVARGCALRCAMLSPSHIVRDYKIEDSFPYSIIIPTPQGDISLFPKGFPFPNLKLMNHLNKIPFYFQVAYKKEMDFPAGISHIVGHFGIGPNEPSDAENLKVEVEFRMKLNDNGIVEIDSATVIEDKRSSGVSALFNGWTMGTDSHMLDLLISKNLDVSTTNDELYEAEKKEKVLSEQDIKVETTKDQRNTLESFVYNTRSKLLEPVESRYNEDIAIEKEKKALQACIAKYHVRADSLPADKKEKVKNACAKTEQWLINAVSQKHLFAKTLSTDISNAILLLESDCESIIRLRSSSSRLKELMDADQNYQTADTNQKGQPVGSENARTKAANALRTCIAKYRLQAESLPADMKRKIDNVCREAEQRHIDVVSQKHLSSKTFPAEINHIIQFVESKCKSITRSRSSIPKHAEPVHSDQRNQIIEPDQKDNPLGSNVTKAVNSLQICIEKYCSLAELLPADTKEKLETECTQAEKWLKNIISEKHLSPNTITAYVNHAMKTFESNCETIIISKPPFPRHEEPMESHKGAQHMDKDQQNQPADSDQREQPMDVNQVKQSQRDTPYESQVNE
ncbi:hypothetical protein R6Q57_029981 [Mikania cordata]